MSQQAVPDRTAQHYQIQVPMDLVKDAGADARWDLPIQVKAASLISILGGPTRAARWLHVSRSQPSRWVRGQELPSPTSARAVIDFEYVLSRLLQVYEPKTALTWMDSPNAYLDGAAPRTVLQAQGPARVVAAIDATMSGSYA